MLTEGHPEICAQIEACNGIQALVPAPQPLSLFTKLQDLACSDCSRLLSPTDPARNCV